MEKCLGFLDYLVVAFSCIEVHLSLTDDNGGRARRVPVVEKLRTRNPSRQKPVPQYQGREKTTVIVYLTYVTNNPVVTEYRFGMINGVLRAPEIFKTKHQSVFVLNHTQYLIR